MTKKPSPRSSVKENILDELCKKYTHVPMIWRIIYHEGMRGNHILFSRDELDEISQTTKTGWEEGSSDRLADLFCGLLNESSFRNIRQCIKPLSLNQKQKVFNLYSRQILRWNDQYKQSLN